MRNELSSKDTQALFALVYNELRQLAAHKMKAEFSGHTLQPTALVHEAWLRLAGEGQKEWQSRAQFFSAAGEAMRRILIDQARRKLSQKRSLDAVPEELAGPEIVSDVPSNHMIAVHEALEKLFGLNAQAAELVKLRYFVGMTLEEAAEAMDISLRSVNRLWVYARAWLLREISDAGQGGSLLTQD